MVAGLAHESRNLLQRSHACLEALRLDIVDRPDAMKQAGRIQGALDQLHRLYEEVRNYAAPIRLEVGEFDLVQLIRQSWQNLDGRWRERDVQFTLRFEESRSHTIKADAQRLDQVFTNIFQNALEACNGSVSIVCEIAATPNDRKWRIAIRDTGPGISDEVAERIFEPFVTTKAQGTGLGMAICRRIIDSHGGTISAGTGPQGGAEIRIDLPAHLPLLTAIVS
jgi:signal transduction histidine kinase